MCVYVCGGGGGRRGRGGQPEIGITLQATQSSHSTSCIQGLYANSPVACVFVHLDLIVVMGAPVGLFGWEYTLYTHTCDYMCRRDAAFACVHSATGGGAFDCECRRLAAVSRCWRVGVIGALELALSVSRQGA